MKKNICYFIAICFLCACAKDNSSVSNNSIVGHWNWFKTTHELGTTTSQSSGKTWDMTFLAHMQCTSAGTLFPSETGVYQLSNDSLYIKFDSDSLRMGFRYLIMHDTLSIDANSQADGFVFFFVRL